MKYIILLICFFISLKATYSQKNKFRLSSEILNDSTVKDQAQSLSFIGLFKQSLILDEKRTKPSKNDTINTSDLHFFEAHKYIIERAKNERIIMINEAHFNPQHRAFTMSLLKELYDIGFHYLGGETFSYYDTLINIRKYPINISGHYTNEPVYGELIRYALNLGYTTFSYEKKEKPKYIIKDGVLDTSSEECMDRETKQALHILQILKNDTNAKIIIHAGYGHITESKKSMGGIFKNISGIDPFTIDQTFFCEKNDINKERRLYTAFNEKSSSILINNGQFLNQYSYVDICVFHPRTTYKYNRPHWIDLKDLRKPFIVNELLKDCELPCLVLAYYQNEFKTHNIAAIPADAFEILSIDSENAVFLKPGKYTLILKSKSSTKEVEIDFQ